MSHRLSARGRAHPKGPVSEMLRNAFARACREIHAEEMEWVEEGGSEEDAEESAKVSGTQGGGEGIPAWYADAQVFGTSPFEQLSAEKAHLRLARMGGVRRSAGILHEHLAAAHKAVTEDKGVPIAEKLEAAVREATFKAEAERKARAVRGRDAAKSERALEEESIQRDAYYFWYFTQESAEMESAAQALQKEMLGKIVEDEC